MPAQGSAPQGRDERLAAVKRRGLRLRRRRRLLAVSGPVVVLVAAVALGASAQEDEGPRVVTADEGATGSSTTTTTMTTTTAPDGAGSVTTEPPPTTTTAPTTTTTARPTTTTTTPAPAALEVRLDLASPTVVAGGTLTGELVVTNRRTDPARLAAGGCTPKWGVLLRGPEVEAYPGFRDDCRRGALVFEPGTTLLPFTAQVTYSSCSQDGSGPSPRCLPPPDVMPPLPPGSYEVAVATSGAPELEAAPPVPVEVTAP